VLSCSSSELSRLPYTATAVAQLREAGSPECSARRTLTSSPWGPPRKLLLWPGPNPWIHNASGRGPVRKRPRGGRAPCAPCANRHRPGGSIRQPSALSESSCMNPRMGRCRVRMSAFPPRSNQLRPLTSDVHDAALVLQARGPRSVRLHLRWASGRRRAAQPVGSQRDSASASPGARL